MMKPLTEGTFNRYTMPNALRVATMQGRAPPLTDGVARPSATAPPPDAQPAQAKPTSVAPPAPRPPARAALAPAETVKVAPPAARPPATVRPRRAPADGSGETPASTDPGARPEGSRRGGGPGSRPRSPSRRRGLAASGPRTRGTRGRGAGIRRHAKLAPPVTAPGKKKK